ncbi:MAG: hypothetical protein SFX73_10535 [Kofleriaceae bacterium]|nr:hypothetical protein [Kofleriaceae bacterium]
MSPKVPARPARTSTKPKPAKPKPTKPAKPKSATRKPAKPTPPRTTASSRQPTNPFGLSSRDLRILCEELEESSFAGSGEALYEAATSPGAPPYEEFLLWRALQPGTNVKLEWLEWLEPAWTPEQARRVLANLALHPSDYEDGSFEGAPSRLVDACLRTEAVDPAGLRTVLEGRNWPSFVPRVFAFLAWTRGEPISADDAAALAGMLARTHVRGRRLAVPDAYRGSVPFTCRSLGEALVGTRAWEQAVLAADRWVGAHRLAHVREIFESRPWPELAAALIPYDRSPTPADEQAFVATLTTRQDSDEALITLAATLRAAAARSVFAELAELVVADRVLARGGSVGELATRLRFVTPLPFALETSRRVLAALAPDARREIMRADRERHDTEGRSVIGLADDFDPAVLQAYLELPRLDGPVVGAVGERALSTIEARLAGEQHPTMQLKLRMALWFAIATAVDAGVPLTRGQLAFVAGYPASHPRYAGVLAALPITARDEVYRLAARDNAKLRELLHVAADHPPSDAILREVLAIVVEREPDVDYWGKTVPSLVDYLPGAAPASPAANDPVAALRAASDAIGGARTDIYVFELPGEPAAHDELTRLGRPPGPGERHRHLLTIELEQVPELAAWYPDATILELRVPRILDRSKPSSMYDDTTLSARKRPLVEPTPELPALRDRLRLHRVSVPRRLFSAVDRDRDESLAKLAGLLVKHPGYVMGGAITIQGDGDDVDRGQFVMQLDDSFGIDLGDDGRLYVFTSGASWDCA